MRTMKIPLSILVVFVALCGIGIATSDTTQVQATILPYITLAVPGSITVSTLSPGDNTQAVSGLAVTSNAPWHIFVQSAKNTPIQATIITATSGVRLSMLLGTARMKEDVWPWIHDKCVGPKRAGTDVQLSDDPAPLASGATLGTTQVSFEMKQTVTWDDYPANDYRVAMVFTASN